VGSWEVALELASMGVAGVMAATGLLKNPRAFGQRPPLRSAELPPPPPQGPGPEAAAAEGGGLGALRPEVAQALSMAEEYCSLAARCNAHHACHASLLRAAQRPWPRPSEAMAVLLRGHGRAAQRPWSRPTVLA
jgi:hypothetical protein